MESFPTIYRALAAVKDGVGAVRKEERNQQQNFNFRGVDSVVNASAPLLNKHGVIVVPTIEDYSYDVVEVGRNKTAMGHMLGKVQFTFYGPMGDSVTATVVSESMDSGDKAAAKMMSVAYRIALLQVLNLPTDERDPDMDSYERSGAQERHPANVRQLPKRETARPANIDENGEKREMDRMENMTLLLKAAYDAETLDSLRDVWKKVGDSGLLNENLAKLGISPDRTFMEELYDLSDKLGSPKSDANGTGGTASSGDAGPKVARVRGSK